MNNSLTTLLTKLNWQLNDLSLHLHTTQNQIPVLAKQILHIEEQINQSGFNSLIVNPKFEIDRLNFITQQQEKKEELAMILKNHQDLESKLTEKIQRAKTELKMLENYIEREKLTSNEQQIKEQEDKYSHEISAYQ